MIISIKKFGTILTSRQLGKESYNAFLPYLQNLDRKEKLEIDFEGISTFSPSWGDEFLNPLLEKYGSLIIFKNTQNPSVKETLKFLEETNGWNLNIIS